MSYSNFCPACGEALPSCRQPARGWSRLTGQRCTACGYRVGRFHWKTFGLGIGFGLMLGVGHTIWRYAQPPPPLPPLTTAQASQQALTGNGLVDRAAIKDTLGTTLSRERHRCGAPTKKGTPCQRWVTGTTGYCWQHRKD
ncbi:MAG: hypothetical protein ACUVR8_07685 [Acidobacteriota bacterium]